MTYSIRIAPSSIGGRTLTGPSQAASPPSPRAARPTRTARPRWAKAKRRVLLQGVGRSRASSRAPRGARGPVDAEAAEHHRHESQGDDERSQQGDADHQSEGPHEKPGDAAQEQQRRKGRHGGECPGGIRPGDLRRPGQAGGLPVRSRLQMPHHAFGHHDGIVDHHAHRQGQRREGDHVERLAEGLHQRQGGQQRDGDGRR